jgi:uncharacterized membrane protein
MSDLIAAVAFFLAIHLGIAGTRARAAIVRRTGEKAFSGMFAVLSLAGIVWIVRAYSRAPVEHLWASPPWVRYLAIALAFVGFLLVVIGLLTPNPTTASFGGLVKRDGIVRGMLRVTRHPFLWGVALWALGHLAANGDLASVILFGSFLFLALVGTVSIDAKRRDRYGDQWERFAGATSNVPFGAIAAGRTTFALAEIGLWRIGVALAAFALTFYFHAAIFGAPPLP